MVKGINCSTNLNDRDWAFLRKKSFNFKSTRQVPEFLFSRKAQRENYPPIYSNNAIVKEKLIEISGFILTEN